MPEPREFLIVSNLKAALQAIAVAGGYHYGVDDGAVVLDPDHDVEAMTQLGAPRPFIIVELGDEQWEYHPSGEIRLVMPGVINWAHDPTPPEDAITGVPTVVSDEARMQVYWRGCADVEKALAVDPGRGGHAVDTRISNRRWQPAPGGMGGQTVWAEITFEIIVYRTFGVPA